MTTVGIGLLGGLLSLDSTSVGQFMVSRPVVAGALVGWVLGEPALGMTIGAVLELYLVVSIPAGGARFPDGSTASVVAVASAAGADPMGAVPLAIGVGLVWGQIGGASVTALRHANSAITPEPDDGDRPLRRVTTAHLAGILLDFARGALVTVTGVVVGRFVVGALGGRWPFSASASMALLIVGGAVSAGILLHDLGGIRRRGLAFVIGLTLGVLGTRLL